MEQPNNISAQDTAKVSQINSILSGGDDPSVVKEVPKQPDEPQADETGAEASAKPQEKEVFDPELAFDTDEAQDAQQQAGDPESDASAEEEDSNKPVTLKDIAATLELDSKDLYEIEIPIGAGDEAVSLGSLKDSHKELLKINAERTSYDEHRTTSENELLVSKRQVAQLIHMGQSSGLLDANVLQQIDNIHAGNLQRERASLMDAIPEWQDKTTRDVDFEEMVEVLAPYGIPRNEVESAPDHRFVKFVYDTMKRLRAVKAAKANAKNPPKTINPGGRKGTAKTPLQMKIQAAKGGTVNQKASAIDALING
jgi:hypothetical protein